MRMYNWAGIGARATPADMLKLMTRIGFLLAVQGGICNTGAARGADQAFAEGAAYGDGMIELAVPWPKYEVEWIASIQPREFSGVVKKTIFDANIHTEAAASVAKYHPKARGLSQGIFKLHARNHIIIEDCSFVVCWAPLDEDGRPKGGTGQGCRIADDLAIPVYNLAVKETLDMWVSDVERRKDELPDWM